MKGYVLTISFFMIWINCSCQHHDIIERRKFDMSSNLTLPEIITGIETYLTLPNKYLLQVVSRGETRHYSIGYEEKDGELRDSEWDALMLNDLSANSYKVVILNDTKWNVHAGLECFQIVHSENKIIKIPKLR